MTPIVLVTASAYDKGQGVFRAAEEIDFRSAAEEENALAADVLGCGARAVVVGSEPYHGLLFEALAQSAAGKPALLARFGVGYDNVDTNPIDRSPPIATCGLSTTRS